MFSLYSVGYIIFVLGHLYNLPFVAIEVVIFVGVALVTGRLAELNRKVNQQESEIRKANSELQKQNQAKQLLLTEVHHRIKNDMNIVRSLLLLEAEQTDNQETQSALREAADRVMVVTSVYNRLYRTDDFSTVAVKELADEIVARFSSPAKAGALNLTVLPEQFRIPGTVSVSLGIILNEVITNARKYASGPHGNGSIEVRIEGTDNSHVSLVVEDSGPGFPDDILRDNRYGYGLTIVDALVNQHDGSMTISNRTAGQGADKRTGGIVRVTLKATT